MFELFQVNEEQGRAVLAAMNTVLTLKGRKTPSDIERRSLKAIGKTMFHLDVDVDALPTVFPADLKALIENDELQHEVLHFSAMLPFLSLDDEAARMALVEDIATLFDKTDSMVTEMKALAAGKKMRFAMHLGRDNRSMVGKSTAGTAWGMFKGKLRMDGDEELLRKFMEYQKYPDDTVGYQMARYYTDNEFGFPGTPGEWSSNTLSMHDFHHVMAGYPTTPLGEMCVIAFESGHQGSSKNDLMSTAVFSLLLLQTGVDPMGAGTDSVWKNQLDPDLFFRAFERGGNVVGDLFDEDFDRHSIMFEKMTDVRGRYAIEEEGALVCGNHDKWCGSMGVPSRRESPDLVSKGKIL